MKVFDRPFFKKVAGQGQSPCRARGRENLIRRFWFFLRLLRQKERRGLSQCSICVWYERMNLLVIPLRQSYNQACTLGSGLTNDVNLVIII